MRQGGGRHACFTHCGRGIVAGPSQIEARIRVLGRALRIDTHVARDVLTPRCWTGSHLPCLLMAFDVEASRQGGAQFSEPHVACNGLSLALRFTRIRRDTAPFHGEGRRSNLKLARDIMTPDPACCSPNTTLDEVAKLMVQNNCGEIPIVDASDPPTGV